MPKRRRRTRVPTPVWEREHGALGRRIAGRSPRFYATAGVVLLVLAAVGLVGYAFVADWRADQQRPGSTALQVGDTKYTVKYFTERLRSFVEQAGGAGSQQAQPTTAIPTVVDELTSEAIVLRSAGDLGQSVSDDDIKNEISTQLSLPVTDPTFETRYQTEITNIGVTEEQYRDIVKAGVLRKKLIAKFQADVPASAESVHYRQIALATQAEADGIRKQIEGGADFAQLAMAKSQDTGTKDKGGDAGWAPRGLLDKKVEETLFPLEPGGLATYPTANGAIVFQVTEKQADRPIEDAQKPTLANLALRDWIVEKRGALEIVNDIDLTTGDVDKAFYACDRVYTPCPLQRR